MFSCQKGSSNQDELLTAAHTGLTTTSLEASQPKEAATAAAHEFNSSEPTVRGIQQADDTARQTDLGVKQLSPGGEDMLNQSKHHPAALASTRAPAETLTRTSTADGSSSCEGVLPAQPVAGPRFSFSNSLLPVPQHTTCEGLPLSEPVSKPRFSFSNALPPLPQPSSKTAATQQTRSSRDEEEYAHEAASQTRQQLDASVAEWLVHQMPVTDASLQPDASVSTNAVNGFDRLPLEELEATENRSVPRAVASSSGAAETLSDPECIPVRNAVPAGTGSESDEQRNAMQPLSTQARTTQMGRKAGSAKRQPSIAFQLPGGDGDWMFNITCRAAAPLQAQRAQHEGQSWLAQHAQQAQHAQHPQHAQHAQQALNEQHAQQALSRRPAQAAPLTQPGQTFQEAQHAQQAQHSDASYTLAVSPALTSPHLPSTVKEAVDRFEAWSLSQPSVHKLPVSSQSSPLSLEPSQHASQEPHSAAQAAADGTADKLHSQHQQQQQAPVVQPQNMFRRQPSTGTDETATRLHLQHLQHQQQQQQAMHSSSFPHSAAVVYPQHALPHQHASPLDSWSALQLPQQQQVLHSYSQQPAVTAQAQRAQQAQRGCFQTDISFSEQQDSRHIAAQAQHAQQAVATSSQQQDSRQIAAQAQHAQQAQCSSLQTGINSPAVSLIDATLAAINTNSDLFGLMSHGHTQESAASNSSSFPVQSVHTESSSALGAQQSQAPALNPWLESVSSAAYRGAQQHRSTSSPGIVPEEPWFPPGVPSVYSSPPPPTTAVAGATARRPPLPVLKLSARPAFTDALANPALLQQPWLSPQGNSYFALLLELVPACKMSGIDGVLVDLRQCWHVSKWA